MVGALTALGLTLVEDRPSGLCTVTGCGGRFPSAGAELFLGNAGTAMRPLTAAVAAAGRGTFVLDGSARMRERPIGDLVDGLRQLGVDAQCTQGTGCPPVRVRAAGLPGGLIRLSGSVSSQYLTAVLMAAPLALGPVVIEIADTLVSKPYVDMTVKTMRRFGVVVEHRCEGVRNCALAQLALRRRAQRRPAVVPRAGRPDLRQPGRVVRGGRRVQRVILSGGRRDHGGHRDG